MKTKLATVPAGVGPLQVDDFPEGCERSCKGALHIRPSSTLEATDGELAHLKKHYPAVSAKLRQIGSTASAPKAVKPPSDPGGGSSEGRDSSEGGSGSEGGGSSAETVQPASKGGKGKRGRGSQQ